MATVHVNPATEVLCDWCGRHSDEPLVTVTVVTSRMVFHDDICESCRRAFTDEDDAA